MKIVIDITENAYEAYKEWTKSGVATVEQMVIARGTPLPKGHGRLIDADALKMDKRVCGDRYLCGSPLFVANKVIEQAPTIIEADKEERPS